jgi:hypothetical protein
MIESNPKRLKDLFSLMQKKNVRFAINILAWDRIPEGEGTSFLNIEIS